MGASDETTPRDLDASFLAAPNALAVQEHKLAGLTRSEQEAFVSVLLEPALPAERLQSAVAGYRRRTGR